ncbi:hypothetical protein EB118_09520 [bacterium]|nr:hypothetical protein [bacterium]
MSINLLRNSKVYFTTNIKTTDPDRGRIIEGIGTDPDHTSSTTFEIQVLDDLTFSQTTAVETISVNETGDTPIRGQRTFNTALNPVDFNFTTYMRPNVASTTITCEENVLWNAMFGLDPIGGLNPAWTDGNTTTPTPASCVLTNSAKHQLQRFGLIVIFDNNAFLLDDCSLNTATIDFGIDAIASIQWSGQARRVRRVAAPTITSSGAWTGSLVGTYKPKVTTAPFIANKLTTVTLKSKIGTASSISSSVTTSAIGTNSSGNLVTLGSTTGLSVGDAVGFSGTGVGNISTQIIYYITSINSPDITISPTLGGTNLTLTTATPNLPLTLSKLGTFTAGSAPPAPITKSVNNTTVTTNLINLNNVAGLSIGDAVGFSGTVIGGINTSTTYYITSISSLSSGITISPTPGGTNVTLSTATAPTGTLTLIKLGGSISYTMPLTGGSITLTNNITYLTPAYMGTINEPIAYFTGSRSVTGSLTAYLRTGTGYSAELFQNLVNNIAVDSDPEFYLQVEIGGSASQTKVELEMPGVVLTIPTVNAESVITTTVNFTAQGTINNLFDILQNNEIVLKYYTS